MHRPRFPFLRRPWCAAWLGLLCFVGLTAAARGQLPGEVRGGSQPFDSSDRVSTYAVLNTGTDAVPPGTDVVVAVVFDHDEHWHIHTNAPEVPKELGDPSFYIATAVAVEAPEGSPLVPRASYVQWPQPEPIEVAFMGAPVEYKVFQGRAVVFVPVTVSPDAPAGDAALTLKLTYQACDDLTCLSPVFDQTLELNVPIRPLNELGASTMSDAQRAALGELFAGFDSSVWTEINAGVEPEPEPTQFSLFGWSFEVDPTGPAGFAVFLVVAAFGGLLLNLTPCVLPVIPIKIMGLSQSAGSRGRTLLLGVLMAAGVVGFWLSIGGAIALVAGFSAINELFQENWFTIGVGVFIAVMAVGMCGLFAVRLPKWVYFVNPKQETPLGAVLFGVLTAVLSTPCTAPFMGSAAAAATTMGTPTILMTFGAIGLGMALPYLVLAAFPKLVDRMPRTGPASELIKQVMGLLMLAAAVYFIGVGVASALQKPPAPPSSVYWWGVAGCVIAAAGWLIIRTIQITQRKVPRLAWAVVGIAAIAASVLVAQRLTDEGPIDWVYYTPEAFAEALDDGQVVVMDFTAEWCLNCKAMEQSVLYSDTVVALAEKGGVTFIKVDITSKSNVTGKAMLSDVGRVAIPALVVFGPDGAQRLNADFYTIDQVVTAVTGDSTSDDADRQPG